MIQYRVSDSQELLRIWEQCRTEQEETEIILSEGVYELPHSLKVERDHLTVRGEGEVWIKGSKSVPLSAPDQNGVCEIDLREAGIEDFGKFGEGPYEDFWTAYDIPKPHMCEFGPGAELFDRGIRLPLSRYPKEGFLTITEALGETPTLYDDNRNGSREGIFRCNDLRVREWANEEEPFLIGYWGNDWATQRHSVKKIDPKDGTIEVNPPYHRYGYRDGKCYMNEKGGEFYALNIRGALKKAGEWCIDRKRGKVFLIPRRGQKTVSISVCEDLFLIDGREDIKFKNLHLSESRGCGFRILHSQKIRMYDCLVTLVGAWGILAEDCYRVKAARCRITDVCGGGIGLGGGDRAQLIPSENLVEKCDISHVAQWHKTYLAGIELNGVGATARGNHLHDLLHFGILYQGNNHIIEYNEIARACMESNDAGGIYAGRDWTCRGTVIRYNYIHSMTGRNNGGCTGIYFDDCVSSAEVYGNLLVGFVSGAIQLGGGRDYRIHHNTFYNCGAALRMDSRGRDWGTFMQERLRKHLNEVPYLSDVWAKAYPSLATILTSQPTLPLGNEFDHNTVVGGVGLMMGGENTGEMLSCHDNTYVNGTTTLNHPNFKRPYWKRKPI